jgi:glycosyltransferase involved in cell wall biosynthesis
MPLVSVIVPTCDRPALLPRAVASVLAQTEPELELIVVNAGRAPVAETGDARVRVVAAPGSPHAGATRNAGLAAARGEWVTFLDDDDAYRPGKVAAQLALARASGSPLVLCGGCFHLRGRRRERHTEAAEITGDALLNTTAFGSPFIFHRRGAVRFAADLAAGEDLHYGLAVAAALGLGRVPVATEVLVDVYQDTADAGRTNLRAEAGWRAARRTWREHGPRFSAAARRRFALRARITRAKLLGRPGAVAALAWPLVRAAGAGEARFALNAWLVAAGWGRGRWVT